MARLNGCESCSSDSYKAMRGCNRCAKLSIQKYPGTDRDLVQLFENAISEVAAFMGCDVQIKVLQDDIGNGKE
jgi:hypothetical protein